jgi:2-hydroxy-6-oxonona-2,4-dienedioate hydrolase
MGATRCVGCSRVLSRSDAVAQLDGSSARLVVDVGGAAMVWRRWGDGPLVVLVHGASGSWTHWVRNIRPLAERYTVLVPDLPGFGESELPDVEHSADELARRLVEAGHRLTDASERWRLVGFSFGGIVATLAAARLGERVPRLVLIAAGGLGLAARVPEPPAAGRGGGPVAAERRSLARFMFADPSRIDRLAVQINRANVRRARFRSGRIPASRALLDALPSVSAGVVAIYGDRDPFSGADPQEPLRRLRRVRSDVQGHLLVDAAHWTPYELSDEVNGLISRALD